MLGVRKYPFLRFLRVAMDPMFVRLHRQLQLVLLVSVLALLLVLAGFSCRWLHPSLGLTPILNPPTSQTLTRNIANPNPKTLKSQTPSPQANNTYTYPDSARRPKPPSRRPRIS